MEGKFTNEWAKPEFEYLANNAWDWSEKIDGTNVKIILDNTAENPFKIWGKKATSQPPDFLYNRLVEIFLPIKSALLNDFKDCPQPVVFYGEGYGAKIQKGGSNYKKDGVDFILFDVRIGYWWQERISVENIAKKYGLNFCRSMGTGTILEAIDYTTKGFNSSFGDFLAEGLVLRPKIDILARNYERIITKIKHKDFI